MTFHNLSFRLSEWAHPDISAMVQWKHDSDKSVKIEEPLAILRVGEKGFESELNRFGHGLQGHLCLPFYRIVNSMKKCPNLAWD